MLCKVTLGVLKGASKLNVLLLLFKKQNNKTAKQFTCGYAVTQYIETLANNN